MNGMYSIAQLKKKLREAGYGNFSSTAIADTLKHFGVLHPVANRNGYYRGSNLFDVLIRHISVLRDNEEIYQNNQKYKNNPEQPSQTQPFVNRQKGISRASQELLNADDVAYHGGELEEQRIKDSFNDILRKISI